MDMEWKCTCSESRETEERKMKKKNSGDGGVGDEVEQMLQSAQDELLLKLSVDSHMSRVSPDYLLPDLDRRFQALKSRNRSSSSSSSSSTAKVTTAKSPPQQQQPGLDDDGDLFARFAALKGSSSSSSNSNSMADVSGSGFNRGQCGVVDEEDEVEKIIRWAKDAARLDPSPPSDDDAAGGFSSDEDEHEPKGKASKK